MKLHIVSSLVALVVLFASSAQAQFMRSSDQLGFYAGASVASAKIKDVCSTSAAAGLAVTSCDEKDKSWKLSAGYQFHPNIAVELGYVDLGKYNVTGTAGGATGVLEVKIKAFEFLALGIVPFTTQLSGYVKAGGYRWDADISAAGPGGAGSIGADGTDFTYGIGVKYDFTRNLAARLEWQHYLDTDVRTIGGGIVWHFR
jgi:OOP family OmpA-OmpF porin